MKNLPKGFIELKTASNNSANKTICLFPIKDIIVETYPSSERVYIMSMSDDEVLWQVEESYEEVLNKIKEAQK